VFAPWARRRGGRARFPVDLRPSGVLRSREVALERHGWTFLVLDEQTGQHASLLRRVAGLLPEEDGRATVLLADGIRLDTAAGALREVAGTALSAGRNCLRMALAGSGRTCGRRPCAAQRLAERLGIQILAPDGSVVVLPDGSLFLVHPDGPLSGVGRWVRFCEGRVTGEENARFPSPSWSRWTTDVPESVGHGVRAMAIPSGWLLCHAPGHPHGTVAPGDRAVHPEDPSFAVPADDTWCTVIVGRPEQPPVPDEAVADWLSALDPLLRQRIALAEWGPQPHRPEGNGRLAAVAEALGEEISAWTGLPLLDGDGVRYVVVCDAVGRPSWRPPARRLRCLPGGPVSVTSWDPLPDAFPPSPEALPGRPMFRTETDWQVEIVPQGMWVRPPRTGEQDLPEELHGFQPDPDRALMLVGAQGHPLPRTIWPTVNSLLGVLEPETRERLWVRALGQASPAVLSAGEALADRWNVRWIGPGAATVPKPDGAPAQLDGRERADDSARAALKALLGPALDLMTVAVALSGPPCEGVDTTAVPTIDQVALRAWLTGWQVGSRHLDEWLRSGGGAEHRGYALCVVSALEHLPRYEGLAVRPIAQGTDLSRLRTGQVLREPGFVVACPGPVDWSEPVEAQYLLWCRSARRIERLPDRTPGPLVALAAGTSFRVLRVDPEGTVLLEELPTQGTASAPAGAALDDLRRALTGSPVSRRPPGHPSMGLSIGTDSAGNPYV
jgi:hypothetical protein